MLEDAVLTVSETQPYWYCQCQGEGQRVYFYEELLEGFDQQPNVQRTY
jgi:hypothetical protein